MTHDQDKDWISNKPIFFSGSMVNALLAGRKSQTRRTMMPKRGTTLEDFIAMPLRDDGVQVRCLPVEKLAVPYAVGDRLWVRESWARVGDAEDDIHACPDLRVHVYYRADCVNPEHRRWRPSIHMPRWASRLTLIVTDVRVQRLQDISCADAIAEGIQAGANSATIDCDTPDPRLEFRALWNSTHDPDAWDENPWVAATTFEMHRCNIDALAGFEQAPSPVARLRA